MELNSFLDSLKKSCDTLSEEIKNWDLDYEYENIMKHVEEKYGAKVIWESEFVDGNGNVKVIDEKHHHWTFSWQYGHLGFMSIKKEDEKIARKAAASFLYLWSKGVSCMYAEHMAVLYAKYVKAGEK